MNNLKTKIGKLELKNPVLVASGVCGFGEENVNILNHAGGVVFKTVTLEPREGNLPPRVVDTYEGMLNSIGLENPGIDGLKEKLSCIKKIKTKKIASFLGFDEKEFVIILKKLDSYKIFDAYEINLSCPNVKKGDWFYNLNNLRYLLKKLRLITTKPLIAKLSPETEVVKIAEMCAEFGYDGVTLINTYSGVAVDYKKQRFCLGNIVGGLSGLAIKPLALKWVYEVKGLLEESGIPYQLEVTDFGSSDGAHIHRSPYPIQWCFLGIACQHYHSPVEIVSTTDVECIEKAVLMLVNKYVKQ